jgi:hypothetical protein
MAVDYDAPRNGVLDAGEESLEELKNRRSDASSASVDSDDDSAEVFDLPGADLPDEELTVTVVPMQADEFRCSSCFLVRHRRQLSKHRDGLPVCLECTG